MDKFTDPLIEQIVLCFGAQLGKTETELDALKRQIEEARTNEEFLRFQYNELAKAALEEGEQEEPALVGYGGSAGQLEGDEENQGDQGKYEG